MPSHRTAYRLATVGSIGTALSIVWLMGAVGIVGIEGDPMDLLYFAVLGTGFGGAVATRFEPTGMARAMIATAAMTGVLAAVALLAGRHEAEYSSVLEILGLNAMFAMLFAGCAWLFRAASQESQEPRASTS